MGLMMTLDTLSRDSLANNARLLPGVDSWQQLAHYRRWVGDFLQVSYAIQTHY